MSSANHSAFSFTSRSRISIEEPARRRSIFHCFSSRTAGDVCRDNVKSSQLSSVSLCKISSRNSGTAFWCEVNPSLLAILTCALIAIKTLLLRVNPLRHWIVFDVPGSYKAIWVVSLMNSCDDERKIAGVMYSPMLNTVAKDNKREATSRQFYRGNALSQNSLDLTL
ncbi:hypothetical protein CSK29544_02777 [Cronobacter sakazakii]|nr:hypothetical protein CSK29544_02777 [Cronobacter sakazakii]